MKPKTLFQKLTSNFQKCEEVHVFSNNLPLKLNLTVFNFRALILPTYSIRIFSKTTEDFQQQKFILKFYKPIKPSNMCI